MNNKIKKLNVIAFLFKEIDTELMAVNSYVNRSEVSISDTDSYSDIY